MSGYPRPYGRYVLEERIAMGGMAEIFRARTATEGFQKRVCIKRVLPHFLEDQEFVTMFRDEARTAAKLQHANVVQVFDFGTEEGALYLAMELVDGADLRRVLEASKRKGLPLEVGEAVQITIDVCRGLHHAHTLVENGRALGVVHRDVSPHNVLLSRAGEVKLTDFGIARAAERSTHTSTGIVKGKVAYMAPEQAQGLDFDHRLDQFATGVLLWEMLTGARLFAGDNDAVVLRKVLACDVPAPSSVRAAVPASLDDIVLRALAADPAGRFADMRQLELALSRFLFSGAVDPATADVRNVFARVMGDAATPAKKTNVMPAAAIATEGDLDASSSTESRQRTASGPRGPAEAPRSGVSRVFASSEKQAPAPGPAPVSAPAARSAPWASSSSSSPQVDPNALTVREVSEGMAAAPTADPPTYEKLPSLSEMDRQAASDRLVPAPGSTPTTRTNVPAAGAATISAPRAAVTVDPPASPSILDVTPVVDATPLTRPRRSRMPAAAAVLLVVAAGGAATWWRGRDGAAAAASGPLAASTGPTSESLVAPMAASAPPHLPPSAPTTTSAPLASTPAATPSMDVAAREPEPEPVALEASVVKKPRPAARASGRVSVIVKLKRGWGYLLLGKQRYEVSSGGVTVRLPLGKQTLQFETSTGGLIAVPVDVQEGKAVEVALE